MPHIIYVVAYSENHVIGEGNQMPWYLPDDFKHFKALTLNQTVLMGRKTYESIGRPLPQREMIVLTRNTDFHSDYARVIHSLDELFPLQKDLYVIGGGEIFKLMLPDTDIIYATEVKAHINGDAVFPELSTDQWREVSREHHPKDDKHAFAFDFVEYRRA